MIIGSSLLASMLDDAVEARAGVGPQLRQCSTADPTPSPCGAKRPALEIREGRLVGRDHAGACAGLDRHVADGHALVHRQRFDGRAAILDHVARAAGHADLADDREDQILGRDAPRSRPLTSIASVFGRRCSRHWVASTWPTSVVPMPKARAPNAPCVAV